MMAGGIIGGGAIGAIKSIQRGTIAIAGAGTTNTATITAVDMANSVLRFLGESLTTGAADKGFARLTFTDATTITATRSGGAGTLTVSYEVVEFYPGFIKSIQRGTIVTNNVASNTATITAVDTTKSQVDHLGSLNNDSGSLDAGNWRTRLTLTNGTTVTANYGNTSALSATTGYQVVEYY